MVGGLGGTPADELADQDVPGTDLWRDLARVTDRLGSAATPEAALGTLHRFVARSAGEPDPLVAKAVARLMPWRDGGTAGLPGLRLALRRRVGDPVTRRTRSRRGRR